VDRSVIFVHSPGFLEEIVRWMCTGISIEEEEIRGGMELMFTDGISAARSAGLDRRAVSVWQGRG